MKLLKSAASLGGEILGINLNQKLNQEQINFLNQCWDDRLVLVFKKQELDDNKLINLTYRDLSYSRNKIEDLKFHKTKN